MFKISDILPNSIISWSEPWRSLSFYLGVSIAVEYVFWRINQIVAIHRAETDRQIWGVIMELRGMGKYWDPNDRV